MRNNKMLKNRKAQLTVFIILGIVVIIGAAAYFYFRQGAEQLPTEVTVAEKTPDQFKPLKDFVESCLNQQLKDAFVSMGQHGGYLDMKDMELSGRQFVLAPEDPTASDAAFLTQDISTGVAYWWYMDSENTCFDCSLTDGNKPSFDRIQRQSDFYIDKNIVGCIDGFRSFENQGFKVDVLGDPVAETKITEKEVTAFLTYPVNASLGGSSIKMTQYYTKIPLEFKKFYDLADEITAAEARTSFIEYVLKEIIGVYSTGANTDRLPPIYAREDSYMTKIWVRNLVKKEIESLLTSYLPLLSLNNTKNSRMITSPDPMTNGMYRSFYYGYLLTENYSDFTVNFYYLGWPTYLYIGPSNGDILRPTRITDIPLSVGPFTIYRPTPTMEYAFFYDISFPVIVEVRRDSELFGKGYSLFFALESNMRDNRDMQEWLSGNGTYGTDIEDIFTVVDKTQMELPETPEQAKESPEQMINKTIQESKTLFCNPRQRISGNITVYVRDRLTDKGIENVKVKFGCGLYEYCTLGGTALERITNKSRLVSQFPVCRGGGIIKLEKEGYMDEVIPDVSIEIDSSEKFEVEMTPLIEKEVKIKEIIVNRTILYWNPVDNFGQNYTKMLSLTPQIIDPVPENDSIMIMITKVDTNPLVNFQTQMVNYGARLNASMIKLVPGKYEVRATFINTRGINITPNLRCMNQDENESFQKGHTDAECYFLPKEMTEAKQLIGGGLELNNASGYWIVNEDKLLANNSIEMRILKLPRVAMVEDFNEMDLIVNLTKDNRLELEPIFHPK